MRERTDLSILVVGHTDATGSFDYNLGLSRRRAEAVVNRLVQLGIEQRRLYPVGVGFSAPGVSRSWGRTGIAESLDTAAVAN